MSSLETPAPSSLAPDMPLPRRRAWANLTAVSGAHAVIHAVVVLLPLIYPILQREYGLSYTQIGLLITVPNLVGGLLQVAFGYLGRVVSRKLLIGGGNILVGLSVFFMGVTASYSGFLGWGVLRSLAGAPQHPVGSAMLTDTFGRKRNGFALAAHVAGGNLGTLVVPFIGTALIVHLGWQPTLMLFALPGIVAGTAVLALTREPAFVTRQRSAAAARPQASRSARARLVASLAPLRHRAVIVIVVASIIAAGGRGVGILTTYVPLYLANGLHLTSGVVAGLFTILLAGSVVGPLVAGHLSDRYGRRPLLLASYGGSAVCSVLLPIVGGAGLPLSVLVLVVALLGLVAYAESSLLQAYLADHAPHAEKDAAFGWYFTMAFGVGALWGTLVGSLIDRTSFLVAFVVMAGSYLVAATVLLLVPRSPAANQLPGS